MTPLITHTDKGLFCAAGGFYIDPHRAVDLALITHAHSDHARRGSKQYICVRSGAGLLKIRIGLKANVQSVEYGESIQLGQVRVSLHPAGHILGSAQVRIQRGDQVWVASGDYKRDPDPSCEPFEPIACDTFITEATFGTPQFQWGKNLDHGRMIWEWWQKNALEGFNSVVFGYSLGKGQRILAELAPHALRPILIHSSMAELTECYRKEGRTLAQTADLAPALEACLNAQSSLQSELILAPPSVLKEGWAQALGRYKTAFASGWMKNQAYGRGSYDHGFVISDHADWNDLNRTILETGAKQVYVQHRNGALIRHLRKQGLDAHPIEALSPQAIAENADPNLSLFDYRPENADGMQ